MTSSNKRGATGSSPSTYKPDFDAPLPVGPADDLGFYRAHPVALTDAARTSLLRGISIRPTTLAETVRANLFPELLEQIVVTIKAKIADMSLDQISSLEETYKSRTGADSASVLVRVEPLRPADSLIPWGILQRDSTLIGAECWHVQRVPHAAKGSVVKPETESSRTPASSDERRALIAKAADIPLEQASRYRVNYYTSMNGDFFYSDVLPHSAGAAAWFDFLRVRARAIMQRYSRDPNPTTANVVQLPESTKHEQTKQKW